MDALYDRMARSVETIPNPRNKHLAEQVLQILACSAHILTIVELSQALGLAAIGILDLTQTVRELCGDFAVADNDGKVGLIHHTAREYLFGSSEMRPFTIDRLEAHKVLFLSSIRNLMSTNVRTKLARNQTPDFLDYAASYWSTHLTNTPLTDVPRTLSPGLAAYYDGNRMPYMQLFQSSARKAPQYTNSLASPSLLKYGEVRHWTFGTIVLPALLSETHLPQLLSHLDRRLLCLLPSET